MINFDFNEYCCGCSSCKNSCPVDAITMFANDEGFLIPSINKNKCINCGKCDRACPYLNSIIKDPSKLSLHDFNKYKAYLYYSTKKERINSASGGFVYDLSVQIVKAGGYVCGCAWNKQLQAVHVVSNIMEDLRRMQSSKYVQSDLNNCFENIRSLLKKEKDVLFCGTPCQTAALKQFLGNQPYQKHLISVCLICHGVPSPTVWEKYKKYLEKKYKARLIDVNMRDKYTAGYSLSNVRFTFDKERTPISAPLHIQKSWPSYLSDPYIFLFSDDLYLRNSCYHCPYKSIYSFADIIVGDFHASTTGAGNLGCSSLIALTTKGNIIIKNMDGVIKSSTVHEIGNTNSAIFTSVKKNPRRTEFFSAMRNTEDGDITFLLRFLTFKFKIKKLLNKLGLFKVVKSIVK